LEFGSERWVVQDLGEDVMIDMTSESVAYMIEVTQNPYFCFYGDEDMLDEIAGRQRGCARRRQRVGE